MTKPERYTRLAQAMRQAVEEQDETCPWCGAILTSNNQCDRCQQQVVEGRRTLPEQDRE